MAPYPIYEQETGKPTGITEEVRKIVVLADPKDTFFNSSFDAENKSFRSGYKRNKMRNTFSCTSPSFMKHPIKNRFYDVNKPS